MILKGKTQMKKIIVAVLLVAMLFATIIPVNAADATFKAYDDAADGELLYTFNFKGDDYFKPKGNGSAEKYFTYEASEDGSALTVKATETCPESNATSYWGGAVEGLEGGKKYAYSFVYKFKANGTNGVNNKVGVGAWFDNGHIMQVINNYGCYNSAAPADAEAYDFSTVMQKGSSKYGEYNSWSNVGEYDTDADGFVTFLLIYDGINQKFAAYILAKGATDINSADSWLQVQSGKMVQNNVADGIGFATFSHYAAVDATIKDAKLYKGTLVTEEETTKAPKVTRPPVTAAPETQPAPAETEPAAQGGGCGGTVTFAGLALVAALGTCAVVSETKKRR